MATYNELRGLFTDSSLKNRIGVAVCIKAHAILQEATPVASRLAWAKAALIATDPEADYLLKYALAANAGLTYQQIISASDAALLVNVSTAVDKLNS